MKVMKLHNKFFRFLSMCLMLCMFCGFTSLAAEPQKVQSKSQMEENSQRVVFPVVEVFQIKNVRVYPMFFNSETNKYDYDKTIYVQNTLNSSDWGQVNTLNVSPQTTQRLLNAIEGHEVTRWRMEMDCYLKNYKDPYRYEFKPCSGGTTIGGMAYNGTRTFELEFSVQNTAATYYDGLKGTFSYYSQNGMVSLSAAGYVYLNSNASGAK